MNPSCMPSFSIFILSLSFNFYLDAYTKSWRKKLDQIPKASRIVV